jgi:hypothetical protein
VITRLAGREKVTDADRRLQNQVFMEMIDRAVAK